MTDSERAEGWAPIPGCPFYVASDLGRIASVDRTINGRRYRGRVLKTRPSNKGYLLVDLVTADGRPVTRTVHTLVLEAFTGPRPPGCEGCHLNDVATDNRLANLRWDTPERNRRDRARNHGQRRSRWRLLRRVKAAARAFATQS